MTIVQIKCLWEVTSRGNFSEAAENLYLTQSSVSKNIMALERELGISLLDRTSRPYKLSPAGSRLMPYFREILLAYERMELTLHEIKSHGRTSKNNCFRLMGMPALTSFGITSLAYAFEKAHPEYKVLISEDDEDRVILALQMGNCDVAFCTNLRLNLPEYNSLKFLTDTITVYYSDQNIHAKTDSPTLRDFADQTWVFPPPQSVHYPVCLDLCQKAGFNPDIVLATSRPSTGMEYLNNHSTNCVYIELASILHRYTGDEGHFLTQLSNTANVEFYIVTRRNVALPQAAKAFLDYVARNSCFSRDTLK
ncbi:MAG: LysR family transcriptional regulator [Lachnospiraceae bacterium]|nr:LysR family transcriptional regulator [Lachnospiraceae bacterium]